MSRLTPYLKFPGNTREALTYYAATFGGEANLFTLEQFGRADGPADAIAHGQIDGGPVELAGADVVGDEAPVKTEGLMLALLGTAEPATMRDWFVTLSDGGQVVDDLQLRPWGDWDGQVTDKYGLTWLIGFHED